VAPLILEPITAEAGSAVTIDPSESPRVLGRSSQCDIVLPDPAGVVSRRHCEVRSVVDRWEIRDLASRHGTLLSGIPLVKDEWTRLADGANLKIGASVFRVRIGLSAFATLVRTMDDRGSASFTIKKVVSPPAPDSARRLELLMMAAASIGAAASDEEIGELAARALLDGTAYGRVSVLRRAAALGANVEVLATRTRPGSAPPGGFSRSLLEAASEGQTVALGGGDAAKFGVSVMTLGIGFAICSPITIDGVVDSFVYADTRTDPGGLDGAGGGGVGDAATPEVVSLCETLATLCGLAFADRHRRSLHAERKRRDDELNAAREMQAIIMPPESGGIAGLSYAMRCVPGRFVAGDMFDFVVIDDHRAALYLGDVVGKGIAAGLVMANVQGHLSRLLRMGTDVSNVVTEVSILVNRYSERFVEERNGTAIFLSLFAAVFDVRARSIRFTDAGHGLWVVRRSDGTSDQPAAAGGVPVGLIAGTTYVTEELTLAAGERFVVFSDGVREQRSVENTEFGATRTAEALSTSSSPGHDAAAIINALARFVGTPVLARGESPFADDVTVASVEFS